MLKKTIRIFLLLVFGVVMTACHQRQNAQEQTGLRIVTSFYPIYSLVKEVSGDKNDIRMIGSRNGIHSYEPSASDVKAIYDADIFIYHSKILESWAGRLEPNLQGSSVKILESSTKLPLLKVSGLEDIDVSQGIDEATVYDPHTWLDPVLVGQEALEIGRLLAESDPSNAEYYKENAEKLNERAQKLTDKYKSVFDKSSIKTFVTQHTAFSYTAQRFGLRQLGIAGVSEEEPSPRKLAEMKEFIETYGVKTIFTEKGVSDKLAKAFVNSTGIRLKQLDPLEADPENNLTYLENLERILQILADELQ